MIQIEKKEQCSGCSACAKRCPKHAIKMEKDREGFYYPAIEKSLCVECGLCEMVCPQTHPAVCSKETQVYACYRNDFGKRLKSASGGIFAVMAEYVMRMGGVVFGAAFDEQWNLKHIGIEKIDQLPILQGSKYVQSVIGETYRQAEEALKNGRIVLFSGTPCQIQGLHCFLGKQYENLISVDMICHGVPSNDIWQLYLAEISKGRKLLSFTQRDKSEGIGNAPLVFEFENGDIIREKYNSNIYISGFRKNLYLRPSCHVCSFKGFNRCSDLTIGDFWGLADYKPEFGDQYGISVLLIHTLRGKSIFDDIQDEITAVECEPDMISPQNPCILTPVEPHIYREKFFEECTQKGFYTTVKQLLRPSTKERFKKKFEIPMYYLWVVKNKLKNKEKL